MIVYQATLFKIVEETGELVKVVVNNPFPYVILQTAAMKLAADSSAPFGKPVVPLENKTAAACLFGSKSSDGMIGLVSSLTTSWNDKLSSVLPPAVTTSCKRATEQLVHASLQKELAFSHHNCQSIKMTSK